MMRAVDKKMDSLQPDLLCQLLRAIVPLGRAAACSRLQPRLALQLAAKALERAQRSTASSVTCPGHVPDMSVRMSRRRARQRSRAGRRRRSRRCSSRAASCAAGHRLPRRVLSLLPRGASSPLCPRAGAAVRRAALAGARRGVRRADGRRRRPPPRLALSRQTTGTLPEPSRNSIPPGDPESMSLAGSLAPPQIAHALWVFVRHLPLLSACHARAPLLAAVRPLVERLFHLLSEVSRDGARCPRLPEMTRLPPPTPPPGRIAASRAALRPARGALSARAAVLAGSPRPPARCAGRDAARDLGHTSARPRPDLGQTSAGPRPDTRPPRRIGPHLGSRSQIEMRLNSNQLRPVHMLPAAWALYELAAAPGGGPQGARAARRAASVAEPSQRPPGTLSVPSRRRAPSRRAAAHGGGAAAARRGRRWA